MHGFIHLLAYHLLNAGLVDNDAWLDEVQKSAEQMHGKSACASHPLLHMVTIGWLYFSPLLAGLPSGQDGPI